MNLANKVFKENKTGNLIRVIDSFENIAILENKDKIDVRRLMDGNFYTEQIDPSNFFSNQGAYNSLAEKIKNIPIENLKDDPEDLVSRIGGNVTPATNESAIILSSEDDERAELARKYGASVDNITSTSKQNEAFAKILGDEADDLPKIQTLRKEQIFVEPENIQKIEVKRDDDVKYQDYIDESSESLEKVSSKLENDPIINMFKNVKRGFDFKMNIEISNKIPRIDFIEMMEDSYEVSIIDFLSEEFTNNLLKNPTYIKNLISERIKQIVYGGEIKKIKKEPILKESLKKVEKNTDNIESNSTKAVEKPVRKRRNSSKKEENKND